MTVLLLFAVLAVAALAGFFAVRASRLGSELGQVRSEREDLVTDRDRMRAEAEALPEISAKLAATEARLEMSEAEKARLLSEDKQKTERTHERVGRMFDDFRSVREETLPDLLAKTEKAASGTERIDRGMTGWMRTIANPQARGAFGELAVENQLRNLGLELGRDFMRQVSGDDGRKRPDYIVRTGDGSVIIDAKFVLDEDIEDVDEALEAEDSERLVEFGRRLKARAEELSKRDYSKVAGRGPSVVLLYVPVEGAYETLKALPGFSIEKFSRSHRVYIVTPSQLGLALGLIAEVAHKARHDEEVGNVADALIDVAEQMADMIDGLDQHGKHLATAFKSYDGLLAMTSTRSKLWRRASTVWDFARRSPKIEGEIRSINPPRSDAGQLAERWREEAAGDA
ncbi:MAG TPA: DNA recombination protein RmuC [Solirubrobacterales bacterium]|jgi:DNA anti-recombination protein RmuC